MEPTLHTPPQGCIFLREKRVRFFSEGSHRFAQLRELCRFRILVLKDYQPVLNKAIKLPSKCNALPKTPRKFPHVDGDEYNWESALVSPCLPASIST